MAATFKPLRWTDLHIDPVTRDLYVTGTIIAVPSAITGNWTLWDGAVVGPGATADAVLDPYPPPYTLYLIVSAATTINVYLFADVPTGILMRSHIFAAAGVLVWTIGHQAYGIRVETTAACTITAKIRTATT